MIKKLFNSGIQLTPVNSYFLYSIAFAFSFTLMTTVYSVYHIEMVKMTPFQLVLTGTILEAACFLFEVPTGIIADNYSRKLSLFIGLLVMGAGLFIEGFFPVFIAVALAQVIWGIGATFLSGADIAWLNDELEGKAVDKVILKGLQIRQIATFAAIILSVFLAGIQVNFPVILSGVSFILFAAAIWIFMPETKFKKQTPGNYNAFKQMKNTFQNGVKEIRGKKFLIILIVISLITGLYSEGFDRLWAFRFWEELSLPFSDEINPIYWFAVFQFGAIIINLTIVEIIKKNLEKNDHRILIGIQSVVNLLISGSIFFFAFTGNFYLAIASFWCAQAMRNTTASIQNIIMNQKIENSEVRATVLSMGGQTDQVGQIIGGPLLGLIASAYSVPAALIISSVLIIPIVLFYAVLRKN
ncbi:MAG: MFS transporter [Rhodothermaceae bacterium]